MATRFGVSVTQVKEIVAGRSYVDMTARTKRQDNSLKVVDAFKSLTPAEQRNPVPVISAKVGLSKRVTLNILRDAKLYVPKKSQKRKPVEELGAPQKKRKGDESSD
ncbi:MAG: hypothetical protein WCG04_02525 [Alphaproteobacteria bacterium]